MNPHTSRLQPDGTTFPPVTPDPPPPPGYVDPLEALEDPTPRGDEASQPDQERPDREHTDQDGAVEGAEA